MNKQSEQKSFFRRHNGGKTNKRIPIKAERLIRELVADKSKDGRQLI